MAREINHLARPLRNMLRLIDSCRVGDTEGKMFDTDECIAIDEAEGLCQAAEIDGVKAMKRLRAIRDLAKVAMELELVIVGSTYYDEICTLATSFIEETEKRFL